MFKSEYRVSGDFLVMATPLVLCPPVPKRIFTRIVALVHSIVLCSEGNPIQAERGWRKRYTQRNRVGACKQCGNSMDWRYFAFPKTAGSGFAILTLRAGELFHQGIAIPDYVAPRQASNSKHVRSFSSSGGALAFMRRCEHRAEFLEAFKIKIADAVYSRIACMCFGVSILPSICSAQAARRGLVIIVVREVLRNRSL